MALCSLFALCPLYGPLSPLRPFEKLWYKWNNLSSFEKCFAERVSSKPRGLSRSTYLLHVIIPIRAIIAIIAHTKFSAIIAKLKICGFETVCQESLQGVPPLLLRPDRDFPDWFYKNVLVLTFPKNFRCYDKLLPLSNSEGSRGIMLHQIKSKHNCFLHILWINFYPQEARPRYSTILGGNSPKNWRSWRDQGRSRGLLRYSHAWYHGSHPGSSKQKIYDVFWITGHKRCQRLATVDRPKKVRKKLNITLLS